MLADAKASAVNEWYAAYENEEPIHEQAAAQLALQCRSLEDGQLREKESRNSSGDYELESE